MSERICTKVTQECPIGLTTYGYFPSLPANTFFAVIFLICSGLQIWLGRRYQTRSYLIAMTLGCIGETIGYGGRIALRYFPFYGMPFQIQIICLIIAPAFNSAAIYIILKHVVNEFGSEFSILRPDYYTKIFITGDVISLVLQGTGGGLAATAKQGHTRQLDIGNDFMMAGISFQVFTLFLFAVLATLYLVRRWRASTVCPLRDTALKTWRSGKFRLFASAFVSAFVCIFIRCVYRILEMNGGWANPIMRDEKTFIAFESWWVLITINSLQQNSFIPAIASHNSRIQGQGLIIKFPKIQKKFGLICSRQFRRLEPNSCHQEYELGSALQS
ncbi:hypothetical protein F1880_001718 [Penicillium rolfsii]|nr:hypothetical protein F1880_001718 [Penicillium rolfsii]